MLRPSKVKPNLQVRYLTLWSQAERRGAPLRDLIVPFWRVSNFRAAATATQLLFFRVDDFSMALKRVRALVTRLEEEPRVNPNTGTMEFALRDPDGYYVMISAFSATESSD